MLQRLFYLKSGLAYTSYAILMTFERPRGLLGFVFFLSISFIGMPPVTGYLQFVLD